MKRKRIIFITTVSRLAARVIPAMIELKKEFDVEVIRLGQSSVNTKHLDRLPFDQLLSANFKKMKNSVGIKYTEQRASSAHRKSVNEILKSVSLDNVACIITDECRGCNYEKTIIDRAKALDIPIIANIHGNLLFTETNRYIKKAFWDYLLCFGKDDAKRFTSNKYNVIAAGIPANDALKNAKRTNEYILVIANTIFPLQSILEFGDKVQVLNRKAFNMMAIKELSNNLGVPLRIKIKHQLNTKVDDEIKQLKSQIPEGVEFKIDVNVENEDDLIRRAKFVVSYGSTMAFKPIQLGVPTIIYKELGPVGSFREYPVLYQLKRQKAKEFFLPENERIKFVNKVVTGGSDFKSTQHYVSAVKNIIDAEEIKQYV